MKLINKCLSLLNLAIPKSKKMISIFGRTAINDNGLALLNYLVKEKSKDYRIYIIISKEVYVPKRYMGNNVAIITNPIKSIIILLRSKWIFHTYGMHKCAMRPARGQIIFSLWHGSPLKRIGKLDTSCNWDFDPQVDSYYLSASSFWNAINKACWGYNDNQLFIGSNPRNDFLFTQRSITLPGVCAGKLVLFMPTFRSSSKLGRKDIHKDLPIINKDNINELDSLLRSINQTLIIKLHPAQDDIPFLHNHYSNIVVYDNKYLDEIGINIYELMALSDALISDFSSVYFDYLLIDRPVGFAIGELDDYKDNRGFTVEDPLSLMPGPTITNLTELEQFLKAINQSNDIYAEQRRSVRELTNEFCGNDACRRITEFVNIV